MPTWYAFEPASVFPAPLARAVEGFSTATRTVARASQVTARALSVAGRLTARAAQNPAEAALRAAIAEIDSFIEGLTESTQAHMIMIPVRKRVLIAPRKGALEAIEDFLDPDEAGMELLQRSKTAVAGPGMFYRTLVESVSDAGDAARPQFPANYATAGVCLLAGGETLSDLSLPLRLFSSLFAGNIRTTPAANVLPVVQNVRVTTLSVRGGTGAILRWDPVSAVRTVPLYTEDVMLARELVVIRVVGAQQPTARTWEELFPGVTLSDDLNDKPFTASARVMARLRNHGHVISYTDAESVDPALTYYYTVAVRYVVDNEPAVGPLSGYTRVTRSTPAPASARGVPPDWKATGTLVELIPPLERAIDTVRRGVSRLGARTTSNAGSLQLVQQAVQQLERSVAQLEATNTELQDVARQLQSITALGNASAGVYATIISQTSGGVQGFLAELARRMSDSEDTSRPELSDASAVVGVVILAGAPRLPQLAAFLGLLRLLFGEQPSNPLREVLRQLDTSALPPTQSASAASGSTSAPVLGYDAAMRPSARATC